MKFVNSTLSYLGNIVDRASKWSNGNILNYQKEKYKFYYKAINSTTRILSKGLYNVAKVVSKPTASLISPYARNISYSAERKKEKKQYKKDLKRKEEEIAYKEQENERLMRELEFERTSSNISRQDTEMFDAIESNPFEHGEIFDNPSSAKGMEFNGDNTFGVNNDFGTMESEFGTEDFNIESKEDFRYNKGFISETEISKTSMGKITGLDTLLKTLVKETNNVATVKWVKDKNSYKVDFGAYRDSHGNIIDKESGFYLTTDLVMLDLLWDGRYTSINKHLLYVANKNNFGKKEEEVISRLLTSTGIRKGDKDISLGIMKFIVNLRGLV